MKVEVAEVVEVVVKVVHAGANILPLISHVYRKDFQDFLRSESKKKLMAEKNFSMTYKRETVKTEKKKGKLARLLIFYRPEWII